MASTSEIASFMLEEAKEAGLIAFHADVCQYSLQALCKGLL